MKPNGLRKLAAVVLWDVITAGTHDKYAEQREAFFRLIVTSSLCIVGVMFLGGFGVLDTILGMQPLGYIFIGIGLVVGANYLYLRRSEDYKFAAAFNVCIVLAAFLYLLCNGGHDNTGPMWFYAFPLVAQSLLGLRRGTIAIFVFLSLASVILFWPGMPLLAADYSTAFRSRFLPTMLVVVVISSIYEYIMSNMQRALIVRNERLSRTVADVTDAQEELSAEKERVAQTLRAIADGVISTDTEGRITLMNRVAEELSGWSEEEARGRSFASVVCLKNRDSREPVEDPVARVLNVGRRLPLADRSVLVSRSGVRRIVAGSGAPIRDRHGELIGVILAFRDVSGQARLEEELLNARKLEAIGILAGGIAHDFNNILSGVLGGAQLARAAIDSDGDPIRHLTSIEMATHRAASLTNQLLTFSKGGAPVKKVTDLSRLLEETAKFALSGSNVVVELEIADSLLPVEVDEGQIGQVVSNLLINAKQAMPDGGAVTIRADNLTEDGLGSSKLPPGEYVRIDVIDGGAGIPKELLPRVFDPYFTTKSGGSGLGLATTYSIVKKHSGSISVESETGKGATFRIHLPASRESVLRDVAVKEDLFLNAGRVLVVDDEPSIRELVADMLILVGCEVVAASDGSEALDLYLRAREAGEPFDLVITDLTIPGGMGGREAIEELRRIDPSVRALVMSGYSDDPIAANFSQYGFRGFVPKPITLESLVRSVREALAEESLATTADGPTKGPPAP